ncbi:hypothetical protein, partial [Bacillus infantis]|uniref:hypothetical protein n=1 Tax=Bacillus infantis TaxID=324767 RepID=UPI0029655EDA
SGAYFFWFTAMFIHALFIVVYDLNMTPVPMSTFYTNLQYIGKLANKKKKLLINITPGITILQTYINLSSFRVNFMNVVRILSFLSFFINHDSAHYFQLQ